MAQIMNQKRGRGATAVGETSSSNSQSSSSNQLSRLPTPGTLTDELAALFECPVCFEIVLPPIMQCQVGHLVCSSCRPKLSCCPTCRGTLGDIRNLAMEKVANNLMFPCKHKQTGCRMSLGLNEKAEHEEVCEFRPYSCPCPGASCSWQGQLEKVMVHLQHAHQNITTLNGEDIVFLATEINLPGAVDWVMMQSCFGHHFMLILEKQEKCDGHTQFFAIVQLIGSRKQAEHFAYSAIKAMDKAEDSFRFIQDNLKHSIFLKQQLKYEESRRKKPDGGSVYKRLSAHITIDLPELPEFSDVVRETANRVESIMKASHT